VRGAGPERSFGHVGDRRLVAAQPGNGGGTAKTSSATGFCGARAMHSNYLAAQMVELVRPRVAPDGLGDGTVAGEQSVGSGTARFAFE